MKTSHQLIAGTLLLNSMLCADVTTLLPYAATIQYDNAPTKSLKDKGTIKGLYFSHGNLDYLFELDYAKTNIRYKNPATSDLTQDDITFAYSRYSKNNFLKLGVHHVNTTDKDLGDGNTFFGTLGTFYWKGYDKFTYALETYYSIYSNGFNDNNIAKKITLLQLSPSFTYSKAININTRNNLHMKINYIHANDYTKKTYWSYELQDTLYYKSFFVNAKILGGQMKSGVRDGGNTVFNTKDVLKTGYGVKLGYYFTPKNLLTVGYEVNNYREYLSTKDGSYSVGLLTYTYTF